MNCVICAEPNVGDGHELVDKHIRNKILHDYAKNRKHFTGNRRGIIVTCNAKTSFTNLIDCAEPRIQVSAKPNEEVQFNFTIKNDANKEDLTILFIQMMQSNIYFKMNDHGLQFGNEQVILKPKTKLDRKVTITFKLRDIGQYEMPITFSFRKPYSIEGILIMRDVVVYVEEKKAVHETIISPYAQKEIIAHRLFNNTFKERNHDMFRIPKSYKSIFASGLKLKDNASEHTKAHFQEIKDIFDTRVTEENYIRFFHNLLWYEETVVRLNLKKYNMSGVRLVRFRIHSYALEVPGLSEKRPSLLLGDVLLVRPFNDENVMFEAVITEMQDNTIVIRGLDESFLEYYSKDALFDIRFFMSRLTLERMHQAVNCVTRDSADQTRVFPNKNKRRVVVKPIKDYFNNMVENNVEQRCAVEHIVAGSAGQAPYLLHGPPGTGKTVTIVEAVLQLVARSPKNRIMVCTDSNMAADHVATQLIKYVHLISDDPHLLLRANSQFRTWECLPACLHTYSNGNSRDTFERITIAEFKMYKIVITTLSHAAKFSKLLEQEGFSRYMTHLFIDEAAQASEPAALIPISGLLAPNGALVLAGDPMQLGPVVISHHVRRLGLGLSMMERLKNNCELYCQERSDPKYVVMLRNNFRSDKDILSIPNELFYKGMLRAHVAEDPLSRVDILDGLRPSRAIGFHGVLSKEQRMGKSPSYYNNMELEIVEKYIIALVNVHKVQPEDIGVVTPYIRQMYKIKDWLKTTTLGGRLEVGTVEAFQGKEKRVILISTVRAACGLLDHDAKFQLGFLVDDKRFNVALTRAKAKAIVIGNPLCLEKDIKWRMYMDRCRELGTYLGYDPAIYNTTEHKQEVVNRIKPQLEKLKIQETKA